MKAFHTQPTYHPDLLRLVEQFGLGEPPRPPPAHQGLFKKTADKIKEKTNSKGRSKTTDPGEGGAGSSTGKAQVRQNIQRNIERTEVLEEAQQKGNQAAAGEIHIDLSPNSTERGNRTTHLGGSEHFESLNCIPETDTQSDTDTDSQSIRSSIA